MKSYENYDKLAKQEELDLFLLNLKKSMTNKSLWLYQFIFISARNKFLFSTSFDRIFEIVKIFKYLIKVRQQQQQQQQQKQQQQQQQKSFLITLPQYLLAFKKSHVFTQEKGWVVVECLFYGCGHYQITRWKSITQNML